MTSPNVYLHTARDLHREPGYSCDRLRMHGGTPNDEEAWFNTFVHEVEHLADPTVGFWDVDWDDQAANDNRVWALLLAHAMRQTGDL